MKHRVGVIGTGFVGSALSAGFEFVLKDKIEIREYDKFKDSENLDSVVNNSDILFICVPTPMMESGECDISIVESVCKEVAEIAEKKKAVIIKSTVVPQTTSNLQKQYGNKLSFVFNPEFLTERNAFSDFINQDKVVLGYAIKDNYTLKVRKLYEDFVQCQTVIGKIYETVSNVAEMLKYTTNCFLATKIAYFNEIYDICKSSNIDYEEVRKLISLDERIGKGFTQVPGWDGKKMFGGKCLPKDLNSLKYFATTVDVDPLLLESVWTRNILHREPDWEDIPGATTKNMDFSKKK